MEGGEAGAGSSSGAVAGKETKWEIGEQSRRGGAASLRWGTVGGKWARIQNRKTLTLP